MADTAAAWMQAHPEIDLVSGDRGEDYAAAARTGAPQARQVADRFHIMKNLVEAVEKALMRCWPEVRRAERSEQRAQEDFENSLLPEVADWRPPPTPSSEKAQEMRRAERMACYQRILELREKGMSIPKIAQQVGKGVRTVHRWLANGSIPQGKHRRKKHSSFEKYAPYVARAMEKWVQKWAAPLGGDQKPRLSGVRASALSLLKSAPHGTDFSGVGRGDRRRKKEGLGKKGGLAVGA
jgi:hypothetical protein